MTTSPRDVLSRLFRSINVTDAVSVISRNICLPYTRFVLSRRLTFQKQLLIINHVLTNDCVVRIINTHMYILF